MLVKGWWIAAACWILALVVFTWATIRGFKIDAAAASPGVHGDAEREHGSAC
jgi:hypothetical protein